jgi:outer membrane protein OmpA-like peptidoglycan-associated protein
MSQRTGDTWGKPVNLGPDVNTSGDEMFPSIRKDGILFFSSNGLPGFGGLDIYSAKNFETRWVVLRNEGLDLNSSADDFGITFLNDSLGYFSSNRTGGKGKDDIYWYRYKSKSMAVEGTVLLTENLKDYAKLKKVYLLDDQGNIIDSTLTDGKGYFSFKNLDGDKHFMAAIDDADPEFAGKARFYLAEKDSVIHRVTARIGKNRFAFKNLPVDASALPDLSTDDNLVLAGNLLYGENPPQALKNTKLKLVSDKGDVMEETTTNDAGAFAFRNIPADQNYMISIEESDVQLPAGTKVTLTNKSGKEIKSFISGKGKFNFKLLSADKAMINDMEADDVNMVMDIYGYMYDQDKKPLVNTKIKVSEENGDNAQQLTTNEKGRFKFKNLAASKNYIFETDENDPSLVGVRRIYIADNKGKIYKIVDLNGGKFSFKILEVDKAAMGEFVVDDPWLKVAEMKQKEKEKIEKVKEPKTKPEPKSKPEPKPKPEAEPEPELDTTLTIVENIYYAYGDYHINAEGEQILNKAVEVLTNNPKLKMQISSHTDAQSSSGFNMRLSQKRAQTAVDFLVSKGINRGRLIARGYGETRLLNRCTDGVECSDDEHKINRRTEFKITKPAKK